MRLLYYWSIDTAKTRLQMFYYPKIKPAIIIIIITGNSDQITGIQCMSMGAKDFIAKPFTPGDLKKSFSKFLEKINP